MPPAFSDDERSGAGAAEARAACSAPQAPRQVDPLPHASTCVRWEPGKTQESFAASGVAESTHDVGDTGLALARREANLDSGESLGTAVLDRSSRDGDAHCVSGGREHARVRLFERLLRDAEQSLGLCFTLALERGPHCASPAALTTH